MRPESREEFCAVPAPRSTPEDAAGTAAGLAFPALSVEEDRPRQRAGAAAIAEPAAAPGPARPRVARARVCALVAALGQALDRAGAGIAGAAAAGATAAELEPVAELAVRAGRAVRLAAVAGAARAAAGTELV